ncbi:MAG: hypothetical protein B6D61_08605 [Bacteroidetes bacterium 4484_249]|nr:MAG: hypothetical protein B6D61_08605 [Bacteroidetes bacterium 4484_249]
MIRLKHILLLLYFLVFIGAGVFAQSGKDTTVHVVEFKWSNDFIFATDRYFSNGLELNYYAPFMQKSPVRYILLPNKKNDVVWNAISFTHHFFTPIELFSYDVIKNDRPFASYFLIGHRKISLNKSRLLKKQSELQIGVLGRYSGGKSIQNSIHEIMWTSKPAKGWGNQIQSDLAINYSVLIEKGFVNSRTFILSGLIDAKLGVPYTYGGIGIKAMAGRIDGYFKDIGVGRNKEWQMYVFGEVRGKYVAYNATLQGGLLNHNNIHVINDINRFLTEIETGIVISHKNLSLKVGQHFISPEFNGGLKHKWGYATLKVGF